MANVRNVLDDSASSPTQTARPLADTYNSRGEAAAYDAQGEMLGQINKSVNEFADEQSLMAGTNAGLKAGLKPDFKPLEGTSLYDKAFNKMGVSSFISGVQVETAQNTDRIYQEHKGDPVGLKQALDAWAGGYEANLFDEAKEGFRKNFAAHSLTYMERARDQNEKDTISLTNANNAMAFQSLLNSTASAAYSIRDDRQFAAVALQNREALLAKMFDGAPREGGEFAGHKIEADPTRLPTYTWEDMQKSLKTFDDTIAEQRALGKFDKSPNKEAFRKNFVETARSYHPASNRDTNYDNLNTKLSTSQETDFQEWKKKYAPNDSGFDYDLRGAFLAGLKPDPQTGHWPDTFKKPNHETFSNQSKFAKDYPDQAGSWSRDEKTYVPPSSGQNVYSPEVVDKIDNKMRAVISHENAEQDRVKTSNALDIQYALDNAAEMGDATGLPQEQDIMDMVDKNQLSPAMGRTLTNRLNKVVSAANEYQVALKNIDTAIQGGIAVDGKDPVQVKAVDRRYNDFASSLANQPAPQQSEMKARFAGQLGMVPSAMAAEVRTGLRSQNPNQVVASVDLLNRMKTTNPRLIDALPEDDKHYYESVNTNMDQGLSAEDAINKSREMINVPPAQKEARKKEYDEIIKARPSSKWIASQTGRWFSSDPSVDAQMELEFDQQARSNYQQNGNLEASRKMALQTINSVWARSSVGGSERWVKYAPERMWGVSGLSDDDNAKWMNEQIISDLKENSIFNGEITSDRIVVTPNPRVQTSDGRTTYLISIKGEDGIVYTQRDGKGNYAAWVPDWTSSFQYQDLLQKTEKEIRDAKTKRDAHLGGR